MEIGNCKFYSIIQEMPPRKITPPPVHHAEEGPGNLSIVISSIEALVVVLAMLYLWFWPLMTGKI